MVKKAIDIITKLALVGGSVYLISRFLSDTPGRTVVLFGFPIYLNVAYSATIGVASMIGETAGAFFLPMLPQSGTLAEIKKMLLIPSLTAGASWAFIRVSDPRTIELEGNMKPLLYGAGAQLLGDYAYNTFINPPLETVEN